MRLSNKIRFSEAVPEEVQLSTIWGGVFYHPLFVKGGAECLNLDGNPYSLEYDGRNIGVTNVLYQKRAGIKAATIPLLFQYFGPAFYGRSCEAEFFDDVIGEYRRTCDFMYLSFSPEFDSAAKLAGSWRLFKSVTLALTESELKSWGNNFRDDVKNKINKAEREKVRIERSYSLNEKLWELSYTRKKLKPPVKPSDLKKWCSILLDASILRIYSAIFDGREAAFRGQLVFGGFAYDWIAGSDPEFHNLGTNQLLMAEIGSELARDGISVWDLVDARVGSIADFKRSFGAIEYYHWQASKAFSLKGRLFEALRRIKNA